MRRHRDVQKVLLTEGQIRKRVQELAAEISADYADRGLIVVSILKGSVIFCSDLVRRIAIPCALDFIHVSSYRGTESSGKVKLIMDLREAPLGKHLLLVEDIADTGRTLEYIQKDLKKRGAASVRTCVLLDKPERRKASVEIHYRGFTVPDEFVVGYGLDYEEKYRTLPYIGTLKPEIYT